MSSLTFTAPWYRQQFFDASGNPLAGGTVSFYSAGSTAYKSIWLDLTKTNQAPNPMPLDSSGVPKHQYKLESGLYDIAAKDANGVLIDTLYNIEAAGTGSGTTDDHLVLSDSNDATPSYLYNKLAGEMGISISLTEGNYGNAVAISATPWVSATGSDAPGYLINKVSNASGGLKISALSGKVDFALDYSVIKSNLTNTPYAVWWSGSNGSLVGTSSFSFGDPSRQAALFAPSIQASGSMIIGSNGNAFWDEDTFYLSNAVTGSIVELTSGWSNTRYIYAHNNQGTASVVTDKASFANLANQGLVFAAELPNTSEDLIYLHTASGLTYNPTSTLLTTPKLSTGALAISTLTTAGVLVNDAYGNVTSSPVGNFTDDHMVVVSSLDTTPGYLGTKLAAGTNIGFSVTSDSHGQKLWISARSNMLLNPTYVSADYTVLDTDTVIVNLGGAITITMPYPGSTYNGRAIIVRNMGTANIYSITTLLEFQTLAYGEGAQYRCIKDYNNAWVWVTESIWKQP